MAAKLPRIGVEALVSGADQYFKDIAKVASTTSATSKSIQGSTKGLDGITKLLDKFGGSFGSQISSAIGQVQSFQAELPAVAEGLGGVSMGMVAVAAGALAAGAAFVALGNRGASLVGFARAFDNITASAGLLATTLLQDLRRASAGTISDFGLMERANAALSGATGQLAVEMGKNLPRLLEIARVQARVTGKDVDFLFNSLISGIRRGSPLILDNAQLVVSQTAAYEAYAQSIGKSASALTNEEQSIAVLNATITAGNAALIQAGNIAETNAEKNARMNAGFTNILDTLALGVQPAFGRFLDVINRVIAFVGMLTTAINPMLSAFLDMGAALITGPLNAFLSLIEPIGQLISWLLTLVSVILVPVMNAIGSLGTAFGEGVTKIVKFLGDWVNNNLGLNFDNLALNLGRGAGFVFGAFAGGIMEAYNRFIAPAVIGIATFIANFLVGSSPPPMGPLANIDKGGANTMLAWLDGFAGVGLEPVQQVAANVNRVLGDIGKMSMPQVEARLGQLDAALQPFNDQLAIVKSNFDAIADPAKAALDSIDRQMNKALGALSTGAAGSDAAVRALDAQRQKIEDALDSQQNLVDQAQIQQALAAASQGQERTLLSIQEARLKAAQGLAQQTDKVVKADTASAAAAAKGAGGAAAPVEGGAAAGGSAFGLPSVADLISGQGAVNQMGADLGQGFTEGLASSINTGTLDTFNTNNDLLGAQVARIGQSNIGQRLADAFSGVASGIQVHLQEAATTISDWVGGVTDPAREGSIPYAFNALATGDWSALTDSLLLPFDNITEGIAQFIYDNFDPENINSILGTLGLLPTRITNTLSTLGDTFNEAVVVPIQEKITEVGTFISNFFTGTGEGTLKGYIDAGVAWFTELPQRIFDALSSIGGVFYAVLVSPLIAGVNLAIEAIEGLINNTLSALGTALGGLEGLADVVGLGDTLATIQNSLISGINLPRITVPAIPSATMPHARLGGIFGRGVLQAGEHGKEIIANAASKTAVFPAAVTRNIDILAQVLGQPMPMALNGAMNGGGSNSNSSTYNQTFNVNNPANGGNALQQIATLTAMRKGRFS